MQICDKASRLILINIDLILIKLRFFVAVMLQTQDVTDVWGLRYNGAHLNQSEDQKT